MDIDNPPCPHAVKRTGGGYQTGGGYIDGAAEYPKDWRWDPSSPEHCEECKKEAAEAEQGEGD